MFGQVSFPFQDYRSEGQGLIVTLANGSEAHLEPRLPLTWSITPGRIEVRGFMPRDIDVADPHHKGLGHRQPNKLVKRGNRAGGWIATSFSKLKYMK